MKAPFSPYLDALAPKMKKLVELLGKKEALAYKPLVVAIEDEYKKMKNEE